MHNTIMVAGPYTPTTVVIQAVPTTENSPAVPEHTTVETILNMSPKNKAHFKSKKEVIHLILTRVRDEIYFTVNACKTAHECGKLLKGYNKFGNQWTMSVAGARETVGGQVVQQIGIQCFNFKEFEQSDWLADTNEEIDEPELEAHYNYLEKIQKIVQLILFIVNSGCMKHMTGNLKLLWNFIEKYLGFITSKVSITISSRLVNFVMRIWRLLYGNLLVSLEIFRETIYSLTIRVLSDRNQVNSYAIGFHSLISVAQNKVKIAFENADSSSRVELIPSKIKGTEFLNKTLHAFLKKKELSINIVERQNRTLVEAARTMLSASKLPLFFWVEAIATACYTQNRYIIILTHVKMKYHIINDRKPSIKHLHIFGCTCYLTRDGENLDKIKEKGDPCILVGYSTQSKRYRVYNKRTCLIVEFIHLRFGEIKEMYKTFVFNDTSSLIPQQQKALDYDNSDPVPQLQNISPSAYTTVPSQHELDLLFGPLYDEFFTTGTSSVNKSSSPTNKSTKKDTLPSTNIHPTSEPSTPKNVHAEENNDN
uniref:Retroviral polymerase SH3-like domain-containing protein n=1 Tax=Tanacetum cinerariifolium TaxID=118510 RepID=A0A6L2M6U9_TANCI|nr:hypothetical protein [Tanacetum cinerariifolium]